MVDSKAASANWLGPLLDAGRDGDGGALAVAWVGEWRQRCDSIGRAQRGPLIALSERISRYFALFRVATPQEAWSLHHQLRERMRLELHRHRLEPVVAFLFIAMVALDLERLRRALVERSLFGEEGSNEIPSGGEAPAPAARAPITGREAA